MIKTFELTEDEIENAIKPFIRNAKENLWAKTYQCRFIEPGLVNYPEHEMLVLVRKPALDKMAQSFVGKPVINEIHKEVSPDSYKNGEADGVVTRVWFNQTDGWYWCEFLAWDPTTQKNCESKAYSVSCAYTISETGDGGQHNSVAFDGEVLNGQYTHLAIVANPRYEDAGNPIRIIYNSKGGSLMNWKFWKDKEKKVELTNLSEDSVVEIDGKEVKLKDLVDLHNKAEAAKPIKLGMDTVIEVNGNILSIEGLINAFKKAHNADDDEEKKKKEKEEVENAHKSGAHKANKLSNCSLCNAEEKEEKDKEKEEDEKRNAAHKKGLHNEFLDNCKLCNELKNSGGKPFFDLKNTAGVRGEAQTIEPLTSRRDRILAGAERYGSSKS